jgi:RNA polymerase sigma factor (sigma-70 family)
MTMTVRQIASALRPLGPFLARHDAEGFTDNQLLQRFVSCRDETAFEVLVWRHGPMVLAVCRRILHNHQDAEDAFQATLLVLARKARSIGKGSSIGSWLYKVAYRVALRARAQALRRARHEQQAAELPPVSDAGGDDPGWRELGSVLDEELNRLPEKYRAAVVLCYLQGLTNEAAARLLRCPAGTIKTRLARARELLGSRLTQRGLGLGAGMLTLDAGTAARALPAALLNSTVRMGMQTATGQGIVAGAVPAPVANLTEGVLQAMTLGKMKLLATVVVTALTVAGAGVLSYRSLAAEPGPAAGGDAARRREQIKRQIAALQEELHQVEQDAAWEKSAAEGKSAPVAILFGDVSVTREQLADYLLARLNDDRLKAFINQCIVEHACRQKGIVVTDAELEAAWKDDMAKLHASSKDFDEILGRYHKTPYEWKQDVLRPRLLMTKLCRQTVRVTEEDLRQAFAAHHGEKVECQVIRWPCEQKDQAWREYEFILTGAYPFEQAAARQADPALAATKGRLEPFGRHSASNENIEKAAFNLREGEISRPLETPEGLVLIKCLRRIPPDASQDFEKVREDLRQEVLEARIQKEIQKTFEVFKAEARPQILWQPRVP